MRTPMPQIVCVVLFAVLTGGPWTRWYSASAQIVLPTGLQGAYMMNKITMHFCAPGGSTMPSGDVREICYDINNNVCYNETELSMCMDDQLYYCGYRDAIVCQYEDGRGSCIYFNSSSMSIQPLCVCKENGIWPVSDEHESQIRGSCLEIETTTSLSGSNPSGRITAMSDQTTAATSSESDQTTAATSSMNDLTAAATSVKSEQTTAATSSESEQTAGTSSMSDQTAANSSKSDQTTESNAPRKSNNGKVNIIAIVFGTTLAIVLLILLVVCLVKRRRNQTPRKKVTTSPTNSPDVSSVGRAQMQDPLVLGGTEYNYAYDHWPQRNPASNLGNPKPANHYENDHSDRSSIAAGNSPETQEVPKYYELGQSNDGRKAGETLRGPEYYEIEQASNAATGGKTPQAPKYDEVRRRPHEEQRNTGKTPQDSKCFELGQLGYAAIGGKTPQAPQYDEVRRRPLTEQRSTGKTPQDSKCFELEQLGYAAIGGKTPQAPKYDEVRRRPLTQQSSNEKTPQDPTYFKLEHPQDNDNETVFGEVDESANPSPGGSSNQGHDQAYMPSQQTAKPAESGYEPPKEPPSAAERNDASSTYDHLVARTTNRPN